MLLKHFLSNFVNAPEWARINVESVEHFGLTYLIYTEGEIKNAQEEIDSIKKDLERAEDEIDDLEGDKAKLRDELEDLENVLDANKKLLQSYEISPTDTIQGLVERNENLTEQLSQTKQSLARHISINEDLTREVQNLRARKDKATVKRCLTTGKLIANFNGVEYQLIEHEKIN
jgi:chromosome segregation ATPase